MADPADLVENTLAGVTEGIKDLRPGRGQPGAVAATAICAHRNPNRKAVSDPEASRVVKPSVKSKNKDATEGFFGYKRTTAAHANYGIPLAQFITTGRRNDSPELPALMAWAKARHSWFQPAVAVADRGYDAASNHQYLYRQGIIPVIPIRRPSTKTGLHRVVRQTPENRADFQVAAGKPAAGKPLLARAEADNPPRPDGPLETSRLPPWSRRQPASGRIRAGWRGKGPDAELPGNTALTSPKRQGLHQPRYRLRIPRHPFA